MKKKITYKENEKIIEREIDYIPFRYILAIFLVIFETLCVIGFVVLSTIYIPYFFILVIATQLGVSVAIINSKDNPDYKLPWLFFVMLLPIVGFMLYFMFYSRKLSKKQSKRLGTLTKQLVNKDDSVEFDMLKKDNEIIYSQALILTKLAESHLYSNTTISYYPLGEYLFDAMLNDLKKAKRFIFMEYFIVENGVFWSAVLEILKQKVENKVEVRFIYDDIGCMMTLPGNYYKQLQKIGIKAVSFSHLRGQANNEFNNRNHRKITIIDGEIGYTGGINIADEYINQVIKHGHWKDVGIRMQGESVNELTRLFLIDYGINFKKINDDFSNYYSHEQSNEVGFCIPFGDGPKPVYQRHVAKSVILNILNQSRRYVYITTPYLITDNEMLQALENTALRGIDVRIITPHIPDKKLIFHMTRSHYERLMTAGVQIYEYERGFIHSKIYMSDDEVAMVGTINMDYRSLVHHFENGVWIYKHKVISDIKSDFMDTLDKSIHFELGMVKRNAFQKIIQAIVKIFSPLY